MQIYLEKIKNDFSGCSDFNERAIYYGDGKEAHLINIGNYTDRCYISESIMKPLLALESAPKDKNAFFATITSSELCEIENENDSIEKLLCGFALIISELSEGFAVFGAMVKQSASRSVSEPDSEIAVKGPREGFLESSQDNVALLRKRLKTTKFKSEKLSGGTITHTGIYLCYISGIANEKTLSNVRKVIQKATMPGIIDSGYIEHYLQKKSPSVFANVGTSEKPDVVVAKLLEGRIAVICDGSPVVLTLPYLFIESLQSAEDYLKSPIYASFMRLLRFLSMLVSLYLPALYLSSIEHHTSALPYKLYKTVMTLREGVPFGVFGEILTILIIFELIREVGLRMPKAVGNAVGIVAGLVLGDAAISSNLASSPVIMVSSLSALCTFIIPSYMNGIVIIRIINLILAQFFGFPGITLSACFFLIGLCCKESFGIPYFMPFSPIKVQSLCDSLVVMPKEALKHTVTSLYKNGDIGK